MRRVLTIIFSFVAIISNATNYYFSTTDGDDSRSSVQAQSQLTPWKTLIKLNSIMATLVSGDSVLFKRGDIFQGFITANKSGVKFGAYGLAPSNPAISGFNDIVSWSNLGGNIWQSSIPISNLNNCNIVTVNGVNTPMGRIPNAGSWFTVNASSGHSQATITALTGSPNYTGAELIVKTSASWIISRNLIVSQSGSVLNTVNNFDNSQNFTVYNFGSQAFIQNASSTLDQQNEWYYDKATKKLQIYSTISPFNVKATVVDSLLKITAGSVSFNNIDFVGANSDAVQMSSASGVTFTDCNIRYCGDMGVQALNNTCPNFTWNGGSIRDCENSGITDVLTNSNNNWTITNCTFNNIAMVVGSMGSLDGYNFSIGQQNGASTGHLFQNNFIDSAGYIGIFAMGASWTIYHNFVNHYCYNVTDGGGIYTGNHGTNRLIRGNIVLNGMTGAAHGIYTDDNASNITIDSNTVFTARNGIYLHNAHEITLRENKVWDANSASVSMSHDNNDNVANITIRRNQFVSSGTASLANLSYQTSNNPGSETDFGLSDSNYILKPVITDNEAWFTALHSATFNHYTLTQWKAKNVHDIHSFGAPRIVPSKDSVRVEYNATNATVGISLGTTVYVDATGITRSGTLTLGPWQSAILIRTGVGSGNQNPTSDAGADKVITLPTNSVTLTGSGNDPDGSIAAYSWTKISGPSTFNISSPSSATTNVNNLVAGVYQFNLEVTDNQGAKGNDIVQVSVNAANLPPTANAGADKHLNLPTNSTPLVGSGTDVDGTIIGYQWTKISGPATFTLTNATSSTANLSNLVVGTYGIELKVTDNSTNVGRDTVLVVVGTPLNIGPNANAGNDTTIYLPNSTVNLIGINSTDPDGTISFYSWTKISGPAATITTPSSANTTVTGLVQGTYLFRLLVTDDSSATDADTVIVTVNPYSPNFQWNIPQLRFSAYQSYIKLLWATEAEKNNDHFDLEYSDDNKIWKLLVRMKANGNSNTTSAYEYNRNYPSKKTCVKKFLFFCTKYEYTYYPSHSWYRVRSIDKSGNVIISNIVKS